MVAAVDIATDGDEAYGIMKRATLLRLKYRVHDTKKKLQLTQLGVHPKNRAGIYPNANRVEHLGIDLLRDGFNVDEAYHEGVCVQEVPMSERRSEVPAVAGYFQWNVANSADPKLKVCFEEHTDASFFVNLPGEYRLHRGLSCLHSDDDNGLFYNSGPAVAVPLDGEAYDRIDNNAGPGTSLGKEVMRLLWDAKIRPFLVPSARETKRQNKKIRLERRIARFELMEKRLRLELMEKQRCQARARKSSNPQLRVTRQFMQKCVRRSLELRNSCGADEQRRSCGADEPSSSIEATSNHQTRRLYAQPSGWWSSSWFSNDWRTNFAWHSWSTDSSSSWQYRDW